MSKDLTEALRALTEGSAGQTTRQDKKLPESRPSPSVPARTGASGPVAQKAPYSSSGGVASPLTETTYASRTFWPTKTMTSTDGVFQISHKPLKSISLTDANSAAVTINFKEPT